MVAVVSGSGLGLFGSSLSVLGSAGIGGNAGLGRGGDRVYVNSATGNLIVQSQDEVLASLGLDLSLIRTYNSQGLLNDDNGDNWRLGVHQRVYGLIGTLNAADSTIIKVFGDGREVIYRYDVAQSRYVSTDGDGAHDTLTNSSGTWTWTDGSGRNTETYDSSGRLTHSLDADGNTTTYTYTDSLLTQITDASGQTTYLDYDGNDLTQVRVVSNDQTQILTRYSYDGSHRLTQVRVDLSPSDNAVTDNNVYTTTYTYDGTSRRIASITQTDGSAITFGYNLIDGQHRLTSYTDALGRVTTLTYTQASGGGGGTQANANTSELSTTETTIEEVEIPPYYEVKSGDTWESIALKLYGNEFLAGTLQNALSNPSLSYPQSFTTIPQILEDSVTGVKYARGSTVPVAQTYYDASNRLIATKHTDSSVVTYEYDQYGNFAARRKHAQGLVDPLWSQDFSQNAAGLALPPGDFMVRDNGSLLVTMRNDSGYQWPVARGTRIHDFDDYVTYRGEVTTFGSSGQYFSYGLSNLTDTSGESRVHGLIFRGGWLVAEHLVDGNWSEELIGATKDNTTYVVELVTHAQGTTLYAYEKGASREFGFRHDLAGTASAWGTSRSYSYTQGDPSITEQYVRFDNVTETPAHGALVGSQIAPISAQDAVDSFIDRHVDTYANLAGQYGDPPHRYSVEVPAGASQLVIDLRGLGSGNADLFLRYEGPPTENLYDYRSYIGGNVDFIVVPAPAAGTWHVAVVASDDYANETLKIRYDVPQAGSQRYTVQTGDTWSSISQQLYGTTALADELQAALGNPTLQAPQRLTNLPTTLTRTQPTRAVGILDAASGSSVPVEQAYYDNSRLVATRHTDGSVVTYEYDAAGNLATRRQHAQAPITPSWFQDFTQNADGMAPLPGYMTHENGGLTFTTRNDIQSYEWPVSYGSRVHGFDDYVVYRGEVTLGGGGRRFYFGASNKTDTSGESRVHGVAFESDGRIYAEYLQGDWGTRLLGTAEDNKTYVVEVVTHSTGSTLYVYEKGLGREEGYQHTFTASPADWGTSRLFAGTHGSPEETVQTVRLDNVTESSAAGVLVGGKIAPYSASDVVDRFITRTQVTHSSLSGALNDPPHTYTIEVPEGASQLLIDLDGLPSNQADIYLRYEAPASASNFDYWSWLGGSTERIRVPAPAAGTWHVAVEAAGNYSDVTLRMTYDVPPLAARSYAVQTGDTWSSIAQALYGISALADELQAALGNPALTPSAVLTGLPQLLVEEDQTVTTNSPLDLDEVVHTELQEVTHTVPAYYTVRTDDTWASITQTIYDTSDSNAIAALQAALGNPTLTTGLALTVPLTLTYGGSGGSSGPVVYLQTDVLDALGQTTTYERDEQGRLTKVLGASVNGSRPETHYAYDADGNLTSITEDPSGLNRVTAFGYDANGNLLSTRDSLGNTITRTYNGNNQLLTETRYVVPDPDGAGSGQPAQALTTRYAYDAENHLRFVISAAGRVTEHRYDAAGQRVMSLTYPPAAPYTAAAFAESDLATWAAGQALYQIERFDYAYDWRGNLSSTSRYTSTNISGNGTPELTRFVYDQRGRLLQRIAARNSGATPDPANPLIPSATTYVYDGLGRVLSTVQWVNQSQYVTTLHAYDDANRSSTTTLANGLVTTSVYNTAGELISVVQSKSGTPQDLGTTRYAYDANGRLRIITDPSGVRQFRYYDEAGRKTAEVDGDGSLTEFIYNRASELIKTIRYAQRIDAVTLASLVDAQGNPTAVTLTALRSAASGNPDADRITRSVYDNAGRLTHAIDEIGAVTQLVYDGAGRVTSEVRYAQRVTIPRTTDEVLASSLAISSSIDDRRSRNFYDADGKLRGTLDGERYLVEYRYDGAGRLVEKTAYANQVSSATWQTDTLEQLRPTTDDETAIDAERDQHHYYFYDAGGLLIGELDAEGYISTITYNDNGWVADRVRYDGRVQYTGGTLSNHLYGGQIDLSTAPYTMVSHYYDGSGRVLTETHRRGSNGQLATTVTGYGYDEVGHLVVTTEANNGADPRTTRVIRDALGRIVQELSAEGRAQITSNMGQAAINQIWDRWGVRYTYDLAGRRTSATSRPNDSQTNTTLYYYDEDGRLRFEVNARGEVKENRYNAFGQLTDTLAYTTRISTTSLAGGLVDSTLLDRVGAAATADAAAPSTYTAHTTYAYTLTGRVETTTQRTSGNAAENSVVTSLYNAFGEERQRTQQLNATDNLVSELHYDRRGLLTAASRDPSGLNVTELRQYDAFGRLTQHTDGRGNTSRAEYDRLGRQLASIDTLNARRTTSYDAFGRTLTTTDALGNTTVYTYDDQNRRMTVTTPEGIQVVTQFTEHAQILSVTAAGNTTSYTYNKNGQVIAVSDNLGTLETRHYDRGGRADEQIDARGTLTRFAYDAVDRVLTRTVDASGGGLALATTYTYDGQGRVISITDDKGTVTQTAYDRAGRITQVSVDPSGLNIRTTYSYDRAGRVITVTEGAGSANPRVVQYAYDVLGRRTQEVVDPSGLDLTTDYEYDANGNMVRKNDPEGNVTIYAYDAGNRLRYVVDAMWGLTETTYDANGRVASSTRYGGYVDSAGFPDTGPVSVALIASAPRTYDTDPPMDRTQRYVYDADGREVFQINAMGGVTRKQYDSRGNVVRQVMYSERIPTTSYGTVQQVQAALDIANDGNVANDRESRTVYDARGRARYAIDGLGGVVRSDYDAAGNVVAQTAFATAFADATVPSLAAIDTWAASNSQSADRVTQMWYDAANRLRFTLDAEGYLRERRYDDVGRVELAIVYAGKPTVATAASLYEVTEAAAVVVNTAVDQRTDTLYDRAGRAVRVTDATGAFETYGYDAVGNRISFTNKKLSTWTYVYDANRRLIEETSPQVAITTVVDADGREIYYGSSGTDLSSSTVNDVIITRIEYDALGNVTRRIEAYGRVDERTTEYGYDELGRQTSVSHGEMYVYADDYVSAYGRDERMWMEDLREIRSYTTYDALGDAITNEDVGGRRTERVYDELGRVRFIVDAEYYVTEYRYDTFGNQTELVRYDRSYGQYDEEDDEWLGGGPVDMDHLSAWASANTTSADRTITTQYDRLNRAVRVTQPESLVFLPNVGQPGGELVSVGATTVNEYNVQGQLVRQSQLVDPLTNQWASTHSYYDERGNMTAQINALGYVTKHEYDAAGNKTRTVEYAQALAAGTWSVTGFSAPVATTPLTSLNDPAGYDRATEWTYDRLGRMTAERRIGIAHTQLVNSVPVSAVADATMTFGYDALGNRTRVTDAAGASTYSYYDDLGRLIATAAPARDRGDGTFLTPLTRMRRDAFGNMVGHTVYAQGASSATETAFAVTASFADQTTTILVDQLNHTLQTVDASGAKRFASYYESGQLGREWQSVSVEGSTNQTIATHYDYDRLGRQTRVEETRTGDHNVSTRISYNAFGEKIRVKTVLRSEGDIPQRDEYFHYDRAGRMWRTNGGDGVQKVYLHNLAGQATAEIRSQERHLGQSNVTQAIAAALTDRHIRTETRYDLLGRVVEQRLPQFTPTNPDNDLSVIGTTFRIDNNVLGPSNPDAVYRMVMREVGFGFEFFSFVVPVLDPGASAAQGGGYYYRPASTSNVSLWERDTNYQLVASRYMHWARPENFGGSYDVRAIKASFEYRVPGDPNGAWTTLRVVDLPGNEFGVDIGALPVGTFEYRVTYTQANKQRAYAIATGTMTLDATNATLVDTTLATLAADNVTPTSITVEVPTNTQFRDARFRIGGFSTLNPLDGLVYRRVVSGAQVNYVVDREATLAQGGGYYLTAGGYVQDASYNPLTSRSIRWNPPAESGLTATFEFRPLFNSGDWDDRSVTLLGSGEYSVAIGDLDSGEYEYRIVYRNSANVEVAAASGQFGIIPSDSTSEMTIAPDAADDAGKVAPIGQRPAGSNAVSTEVVTSSGFSGLSGSGLSFTGTNDVLVKFPPIAGPVRVELEYVTRAVSPADDPGPSGEGWTAESRRLSLSFADASGAASGLHMIWSDPTVPVTAGGVSQIAKVRVYSIAGNGDATLRYASADGDAAAIGGTTLSWDAPWNTAVSATFEVRAVGATTWEALTVSRASGDFSVDVQGLSAGSWEYRVIYTLNGATRARSEGVFTKSGGSVTNIVESGSPAPIEPVAPVSGLITSDVGITVTSSATQVPDGSPVDGRALNMRWDGTNQLDLTWADIGAGQLRVVVDYTSAARYSYNYSSSTPPRWDTTATYVAGSLTSRTEEFSGGVNGVTMSWSNANGDVGGVQTVHRVRVYMYVGNQWVLKLDRDAGVPAGGTTLSWPAADNAAVDASFRARPVGSTTWQSISVSDSANGMHVVDLDALTAQEYEYEIKYSITDGAVTTVTALTTGKFTISAAQSGEPRTRRLDVTQNNVAFDRGANDFGPVSWNGAQVSWTRAPDSGDTIVLRTRAVGTSTWQEQTISGAGPDYSAAATAAANQAVEFEIHYTHTGESTPYASSRGTLNGSVAVVRTPPVVTLTQVSAFESVIAPVENVANDFGRLTWTTEKNPGSGTVVFRYQLANGTWQTLTPIWTGESYYVDQTTLPVGTYRYEIVYQMSGATLPYAYASGSMTIDGAGDELTIIDTTRYTETLVQETNASTPTQVQTFDRWGNAISVTNSLGNTTNYRYNQFGALIETRLPEVQIVDTTGAVLTTRTARPVLENFYDLLGRVVATRDANGNINYVDYNAGGQVIAEHYADGGAKHYTHDIFGNRVLITDELGFRTANGYDTANRLTRVERELTHGGLGSSTGAIVQQYEYDDAGRRISEIDGEGRRTRYRYDAQGNVVRRTTPREFETQYEYDSEGNKIREVDANGFEATWTYEQGRLVQHRDFGGTETYYLYNNAGLLIRQINTLGQDLTYAYDRAGHLLRILDQGVAKAGADVVSSNRLTEYAYDIAGRRIIERTTVDNRIQQDSRISYDALDRMTRVQDPDFVVDYSYDAVGNRTRITNQYYDHMSNQQAQDLWYTYDEMNRVRVTQGVLNGNAIGITATQGAELTYDLKGQRISARTSGERLTLQTVYSWPMVGTAYVKNIGLFTEHYGYDGTGRLVWTEQDVPTSTFDQETGEMTDTGTVRVRTNTRHYDRASLETVNDSFGLDGAVGAYAGSLTLTQRFSYYDADGRTTSQHTYKNNIIQFDVVYGDAEYVPEQLVPIGGTEAREHVASVYDSAGRSGPSKGGAGSESVGSLRKVARTLTSILPRLGNQAGVPEGYVRIPGHWVGTGFDRTGVLHGYKVWTHQPNNGKWLYETVHTLNYRIADSYQLINEETYSWTGVHNISIPGKGSTFRTYNVNGELVQYSDGRDGAKNRYFANDAQGRTLSVIQGNFDGKSGRLQLDQAWDQAVSRTGNQVKAQHFFSANDMALGSFGQLSGEGGAFEANFDVNYEPVSSSYPSSVPGTVIAQGGDTLRSIAARVFGDASLWYVIAEENGLSEPDATLEAGTQLRVPNNVVSLANNAYSFKPFDIADAIGDTTPTQPAINRAKKKKFGFLGKLLLIVVAIVVTAFTGPWLSTVFSGAGIFGSALGYGLGAALGNAASQGVAIATDMQDEFNWKSLGAAAVTGMLLPGGGAPGGLSFTEAVLQGALNSAVSQGVNILFGVQDSFSWRDVAIGAASAGVTSKVGKWTQDVLPAGMSAGTAQFIRNLTTGAVSAQIRRALGGRMDTTEVLTDVFGNALGNSIADRIVPQPAVTPEPIGALPDELQEVRITARYIGPRAAAANALLDNNPAGSIRSGSEVMPDDLRQTENIPDNPEPGFGVEPLEGVIVTASRSNLDLAPTSVQVVIGSEIWQRRRALNYAAIAVAGTTQATLPGRVAAGALVAGVALTAAYKAYQRNGADNPNAGFVSDGLGLPWRSESPNPGPIKPFTTTSPPSDPLNPILSGAPNTGPDRGSVYENPYHDPIGRTTTESPSDTNVDPGLVMLSTRGKERPTDLAPVYEQQIRDMYGSASLGQRQFRVLDKDGRLARRTADGVAIIDGQDVVIEAKFVSDFSNSPYNPDSFAGRTFRDERTGLTEFERNVEQARTYSSHFESVIYHSNNQEFIDYYRAVFERENLTNVRFIQTPLKRP